MYVRFVFSVRREHEKRTIWDTSEGHMTIIAAAAAPTTTAILVVINWDDS